MFTVFKRQTRLESSRVGSTHIIIFIQNPLHSWNSEKKHKYKYYIVCSEIPLSYEQFYDILNKRT